MTCTQQKVEVLKEKREKKFTMSSVGAIGGALCPTPLVWGCLLSTSLIDPDKAKSWNWVWFCCCLLWCLFWLDFSLSEDTLLNWHRRPLSIAVVGNHFSSASLYFLTLSYKTETHLIKYSEDRPPCLRFSFIWSGYSLLDIFPLK